MWVQDAQWFQSEFHREPHYVLEIQAVLPPDDAHPLLCDTACGARVGLGVGGRQLGLTAQHLAGGQLAAGWDLFRDLPSQSGVL